MRLTRLGITTGVLTLLGAAACSTPVRPSASSGACIIATELRSWKAPDARTIYLRFARERVYRLELAGECPELLAPGARLVFVAHAAGLMCSAADWQLAVAGPGVPPARCQVTAVQALSPEQVRALPPASRP